MLLDVIKPGALLLCMLSLCAVFHATFLVPAASVEDRLRHGLLLLLLAGCIAIVSGLLFQDSATHEASSPADKTGLMATLPMQVFLWTTVALSILFAVSWYLETYCVFYRDTRRF